MCIRDSFIAAPKALKSYFGTGLFAIIIHPITFYCSPFFLDMSTPVSYTHLDVYKRQIGGGSHGYYHLEDKRIAINEGMSELQDVYNRQPLPRTGTRPL